VSNKGVAWEIKSRQRQGIDTEKRILKQRGAQRHPRSGAGHIKEDGSDAEYLYEIKDARKTFTLKASDLRQSYVRACRQGLTAVWLIEFEAGFTLECRMVPGTSTDLIGVRNVRIEDPA
jgi:hypothetical protein